MTILWLFDWTTGSENNPLFHIDGSLNLADLLTKKHELGIELVSKGSAWIEGLDWMKKDKLEHAHLMVEKPIIAEIMVDPEEDECDDDSEEMTIPFLGFSTLRGQGYGGTISGSCVSWLEESTEDNWIFTVLVQYA